MEIFLRTIVRVVGGSIVATVAGFVLFIVWLFGLWVIFASKGLSTDQASELILNSVPFGHEVAGALAVVGFIFVATASARLFDLMWKNESSLKADLIAVLILTGICFGGYMRVQSETASGQTTQQSLQ